MRSFGRPGTEKHQLATVLAGKVVQAERSVVILPRAELIAPLAKARRDGALRERIRYLGLASHPVAVEIVYLPVVPGGGHLFFEFVITRFEKPRRFWPKITAMAHDPRC